VRTRMRRLSLNNVVDMKKPRLILKLPWIVPFNVEASELWRKGRLIVRGSSSKTL
jgi:hypothetical protein